jgi:hypothetical protein
MRESSIRALAFVGTLLTAVVMGPRVANAACGCDKPPPPQARIRPFVTSANQMITLFDDRLKPGDYFTVLFKARDGSTDWSRAKAGLRRDFADGTRRRQLRVTVGELPLGPVAVSVYDDANRHVYTLPDSELTITSAPIVLHDFDETLDRNGYRAGVSADGTIYIAIDTSDVTDATTYSGTAHGFPLSFDSSNVAIFNSQGFLMGLLPPDSPGLFQITPGESDDSATLAYWRHEFRTYKDEHRQRDVRRTDDGEWHLDGTPHVDNFRMVVAISGKLPDGTRPTPGATPAFRLVVNSVPSPQSNLH